LTAIANEKLVRISREQVEEIASIEKKKNDQLQKVCLNDAPSTCAALQRYDEVFDTEKVRK